MFAPTKTWRRWHRKTNLHQKRYAVCSALAASALPSLVMARGHRIDQVPEIPLVVTIDVTADLSKTKDAVAILKGINAFTDVEKVKNSVKIRAGKGKMRNRRRVHRRGPLVVYDKKQPYLQAFRNIPGLELISIDRLNILQLAPGGHLGRFVIWFSDAFNKLDAYFGTQKYFSKEKSGFKIPRPIMTNPDLGRIINSDEIQSRLRPIIKQRLYHIRKKNPLTNLGFMIKLNPYAKVQRRRQILGDKLRQEKRAEIVKQKRAETKKHQKRVKKIKGDRVKLLLENPCFYEAYDNEGNRVNKN